MLSLPDTGYHSTNFHLIVCVAARFQWNTPLPVKRVASSLIATTTCDITADLLNEICNDVEEEPMLQEVTGEHFKAKTAKVEKDARLDVAARGFWIEGNGHFVM